MDHKTSQAQAVKAIADGDIVAAIGMIADQLDTMTVPVLGDIVLARIGRTNVAVKGDGEMEGHTHDDVETAIDCHHARVATLGRMIEEFTNDPRAQLLMGLAALASVNTPADMVSNDPSARAGDDAPGFGFA